MHHTKLVHSLVLAAFAIAFSSRAIVANELVNGSFEQFYVGGVNYLPTGWNATGNLGEDARQGVTDGAFAIAFSLQNLPSNGVLSQAFTTVPGANYNLTFDFGKFARSQPDQAARLEVDLFNGSNYVNGTSFNGIIIRDLVVVNNSPSDDPFFPNPSIVYNSYSFPFQAVGTSTTLAFSDTSDPQIGVNGRSGGFDAMLDNVSVLQTNSVIGANGGSSVTGGVSGTLIPTLVGDFNAPFYEPTTQADIQHTYQTIGAGRVNFYLGSMSGIQVWDLHYSGTFSGPATLTFNYDPTRVDASTASFLRIYHYTNGQWTLPAGEIVDTVNHTITLTVDSFSPFELGYVPEPSSVVMMGLGVIGLAVVARRRMRK